ncbi:AcrR family transcriptional regulator [Sphingobium subterraneum]|uniref:AcrR family transcriptional regulator n=2 Tax=Sphingobium subterraneum TaxID=627688 RepID=A0A841J439_9SPHN|nr:AcrR family transcriptional regulator [Sphingobium subterraneum]
MKPIETLDNQDHRVRVAKIRRERMTERLLRATMECYAEHILTGPPSVDEVIARADVSRATFYKYFVSVDEAIERRAGDLVDEMIESLKHLVVDQKRPIMLFTISLQLFLMRSVLDRTWAAFVAHSDMLRTDGALFDGITQHLAEASAQGEVHFMDAVAARTLAIGAMRETIRSNARSTEVRREFVDNIMSIILISLGVQREEARALVGEATIFIRGAAPDRLSWWRDPWLQWREHA